MGKDFGENKRAIKRRPVSMDADSTDKPSDPTSTEGLRHPEAEGRYTTLEALQVLFARDDGWLRAIPADHGTALHLKWKWTRGKHRNCYVYWYCSDMDYCTAVWGLIGKIELVDAGHAKPTPDTPYE